MPVIQDRFKSYSKLSPEEWNDTTAQLISELSPEEFEVFLAAIDDQDLQGTLSSQEYEEVPVPIDQWLADPFYMGAAAKALYASWTRDLIELFSTSQYQQALIVGGIGCLAEFTLVDTIDGKRAMGDITSATQYLSWTGSSFEYRWGTASFAKGKASLYRIVTEQGEFTASADHLVLCDDGVYRKVSELLCSEIRTIAAAPHQSNGLSNALIETRTTQDSMDGCYEYLHPYGERPLLGAEVGQGLLPSLAYESSRVSCRLGSRLSDSHAPRRIAHLASRSSSHREALQRALRVAYSLRQTSRQRLGHVPQVPQSQGSFARHQRAPGPALFAQESSPFDPRMDDLQRLGAVGRFAGRTAKQSTARSRLLSQSHRRFASRQLEQEFSRNVLVAGGESPWRPPSGVTRILAIEKCKPDWYWDLQVPGTHNYVAEGVVHHNSGKTEFSSFAILRMIYEASCLRDPARSYGLAPGSKIGFCNLAPSETTARRATFEKITDKLRQSPYFMEMFPPLNAFREGKPFRGNEILFSKGLVIVSGSSTDTAILGTNVMGGFIDELNFFRRDAKNTSHMNANRDRFGEFSKAGRLFDSLFRRIQSRFLKKGRLPGILIGATSKTTLDSLSERFIRDAAQRGDKTIFVRDRAIIDVKRESFSDKIFQVLVGNEYYRSRILADNEDISELGPEAAVIDVPDDLRRPFETNIDEALRDLAGISTMAISTFITKVEKLIACKDPTRGHPFICHLMPDPQQWDSRMPYSINWEKIATLTDANEWEPRMNPWAKRHAHFDPGLTGDAFGVAIGHVSGLRPVQRTSTHGDPIVEYQPEFVVDFVLRIKGEVGEEVQLRNVRKLIYEFSEHGFHFAKISMDTFQSREMAQQLNAQGYITSIVSVDETKEPYYALRTAIYEGRFVCYDYPPLFDELRCLEDGPTKVDHPPNNSKDLADSCAGLVFTLGEEALQGAPILPAKGFSYTPRDDHDDFNMEPKSSPVQNVEIQLPDADAPKVYKKGPKTIMPSYTRVSQDGRVSDASGQNMGGIDGIETG